MFEAFIGSVEGPYHRQKNLPNQDYVHIHEEEGWFFGAVADGAGSLPFSDQGAWIVASTAIEAMTDARKNLDLEKLLEYGIAAARDQILKKEDHKNFGSTLTLLVLSETGEWGVASVGDSFAVIHGEDGSHTLVTAGGSGEFANITELITSKEINIVVQTGTDALAVSLSTDGLEGVGILKGEAHGGFWDGIRDKAVDGSLQVDKLFRWLDSLEKLVDDTTLLTVARR